VRSFAPHAELIFLADNDPKPNGSNPGMADAIAAAKAFGGRVAIPTVDSGGRCDFWDVWSKRGAEAVKAALEAAKPVQQDAPDSISEHSPEPMPAEAPQPKATDQTATKPAATPAVKPAGPKTFPVVWFSDAAMPEHSPALIKGLIDQGALAVVYGESGSGKTFFTQDMLLHVACGMAWRGRKVQRGLVVYVAAEAGSAILKRFIVWRERRLGETAPRIPLLIVTRGPNLLDGIDVAALIEQLRALAAAASMPIAAVVFDTLSRSIPGGDENKPQDMTALVGVADQLRDELGAATVLVHHTGKDPAKGARGHSSLFAAADLVLAVADGCARVEKVRDGVAGERFAFRLEVIEMGTDQDGDPITTCLVSVEGAAPPPPRRAEDGLNAVGQVALRALREAVSEKGDAMPGTSTIPKGVRAVDLDQWREQFTLRYGEDGKQRAGDAVRQAFKRGKEALLAARLVDISDPYVWLTGASAQA
jgi:KaiC/GvpD/RAD55 family RecA-like ATPase